MNISMFLLQNLILQQQQYKQKDEQKIREEIENKKIILQESNDEQLSI